MQTDNLSAPRTNHTRRESLFFLMLAVGQLSVVVPAQIPGVKFIDSETSQVVLLPHSLARAVLVGVVPAPVYCLLCVGCAWLVVAAVRRGTSADEKLYSAGWFWQVVGAVVTGFAVTSFSSWSRVGVFDVAYTGVLAQRNSRYPLIWGLPMTILFGLGAATIVVALACWLAARRSPLLRIGVLCLAVVGLSVAEVFETATTGSLNWVVAGMTVLCCGAGVGVAYALLPADIRVTADGLPPAGHHTVPQVMK
ncbi:hypothetical protein ACFPVT_05175 [Corynebacterium choanae]|uniref:Uncharacterized protein n=1 Tax=Corynebacterium choanae TaxID=1862358 RepID=A0A3G6J9H8_9CORY|nr:hypothetical protein [Corynebacterium choanae]AZA12684.1 hypothetical protein CCHOA_01280 [Corynebacterium choanae]